ncbi:MAG TPA: cytochrome c [Casimicrobiaceae bacterium]|nr:cytochrome c [Casimicrobiaceae bacterium]
MSASAVLAQGATFTTIERGRYLVQAGDCAACHTADGGQPFAGGRAIPTPFGTVYSTNITPDRDTGIGQWTDEDLYRAMHSGRGPDGRRYYPAFPYPWYTKLTADDVRAIKSYLDVLPAVRQDDKPPELPWPLSVRLGMAAWNALYFEEGVYEPDASKSAAWNRGAYLVEGLGHCGACHTPKSALGGPKKSERLQGGYGEHWYAMSLDGNLTDGLGAWSPQDIVEYLKTGSTVQAAAGGPMAEVVANSTQYLAEADLDAIATYLKDLPDRRGASRTASSSVDKAAMSHGEALYADDCTGCHLENGEGVAGVFPPLRGSAAVRAREPGTVVEAMVDGARVVATKDKPTGLAMPAFGWKLTDAELADLATYIRNAWGNHASAVSKDDVAGIREETKRSAAK